MGWATTKVIGLPAALPAAQLGLFAAAALITTVVAEAVPVRRASRIDMLRAIATV